MSREIKFRAYDKENKVMIWVPYLNMEHGEAIPMGLPTVAGQDEYWNAELMQFTGRKDKNGVEIFEEDIVIADGKKGLVRWNISEPFYWVRFGENKFNYLHDVIHIEKIGNSFENPELLTQSND